MRPPTVSVVIPTYDRLHHLRETVSSVLGQSFPDLEVIVVDDGSGDGTPSYLEALDDRRVRGLRLTHGGNVARVRNAGVAQARGRYLCFLDSDDLWPPRKLEVQLEMTERATGHWSYGAFTLLDAEGRSVRTESAAPYGPSGDIAEPLIATRAPVALCTVMLERDLFATVGGFDEDPDLFLREDFEFLVRLAIAAPAVAIPEVLGHIREHPERATRSWEGAAPFTTTAYAYTKLLGRLRQPAHRRAARRRRAHHRRRAGTQLLRRGFVVSGTTLLLDALADLAASALGRA